MIILNRNREDVCLRRLNKNDFSRLYEYLHHLSEDTRNKFGPHSYDFQSIITFYEDTSCIGFIGETIDSAQIVAYSILKIGYLAHDQPRLESYGLTLNESTDSTFAPSVADNWQGQSIGSYMYKYILSEIEELGINRVILWGGVQANNEKAIKFYQKHHFKQIGEFEYYGMNYDMIFERTEVRSEM